MASTDARPVPRKNVAYRFYFAIRKPSDSTLITTWAGADSEVSLDGAAYSDCTNEATEIGTTGSGYIDLTAAEMNADCVLLKVTVTNTGAVPLVFALYPEEAGDYRSDVVQWLGTAPATPTVAGVPEVDVTHVAGSAQDIATATAIAALKAETAAIVADTSELQTDWANGGRLDLILDARASQSSVDTLAAYVDTEVAAILEDTGTTIPDLIGALLTTAMAESYRADGATGSVAQMLYEIHAEVGEFAITGTTKQQLRLDGSTDAFASILSDATNPTGVTRSTSA